ncbi:MAG: NAD-dependent dihydropyrimidine dehydrogenase subunit PreA [Candidatus Eisenbacteria bacterium]|uniref:dihydrouracil dehydrogenase (NAD(+)) n=1 Tax=Eiseniibacteriota bacterium TaxID=2212470 RepID=A0A7Y2EC15_UNCEI|nr:NAD-dependent dihydropyrimidine dehydrogenase subunit PreA [Candidatus Eisenbacteria bacterium]
MPDLTTNCGGIVSPNPFWLASAPPTNSGGQVQRAFDAGWGGAVWKTLGNPIENVSSRLGGIDVDGRRLVGLNNIELITDRPLEVNLREIREVKKRYPNHAVIVSLMVETKDEWKEIIKRSEDTGADGLELNFGCPHGMCERGMGSAVGQEPEVLREITSWVMEMATTPVLIKLSPSITDILDVGVPAAEAGANGLSLINTVKSLIGVDLDRMVPMPRVGDASTNGGYCGPAVKPIALHMVASLARDSRVNIPISGIGGISTWKDAAEFIALGSTSVQVCTAVMHHGYRIVEDMLDGLNNYLDEKGMASVSELVGAAVPGYKEWGDLDINYHVVADIDTEKCIGCQLCVPACHDGAHQCIHPPGVDPIPGHRAPMAEEAKKRLAASMADTNRGDQQHFDDLYRVPWIDETESVRCNLCQLVCPVDGCITMKEVPHPEGPKTWNERIAEGTAHVPGGLDD